MAWSGFLIFGFLFNVITVMAATVNYTLIVDRIQAAPDGVTRSLIVANYTYPGPLLSANLNDILVVTIINRLNIPTSMHWHGFEQKGTPSMDGATGFTQCPIPANTTFTYRFQATLSGTYWYHSHHAVQSVDGLRGPMVIYDPNDRYKSLYSQEFILHVSDWYHQQADILAAQYLASKVDAATPIPDSGLINANGQFNCDFLDPTLGLACNPHTTIKDKFAVFQVTKGQSYRFRVINIGAFTTFTLSIDNHPLTIIEIDGIAVEPVVVSTISISVAQRVSFIINATNPIKTYWIRADLEEFCFPPTADLSKLNPFIYGILQYKTAVLAPPLTSGKDVLDCEQFNVFNVKPIPASPAPPLTNTSFQLTLNISFAPNKDGYYRAYFGNIAYQLPPINYNPLSVIAKAKNVSSALANISSAINPIILDIPFNATVQFVINNLGVSGEHPIHTHGRHVYILGVGDGVYDPKNQTMVNSLLTKPTDNPPRRDTWTIPLGGWAVVRYVANNPGIWAFHCHIDWHMSNGFAITLIELPRYFQSNFSAPVDQFCSAYPNNGTFPVTDRYNNTST